MSDHQHQHQHHHQVDASEPGTVPLADASVRTGRVSDTPAIGLLQATVWRAAYSSILPPEVLDQFDSAKFTSAWRRSLSEPPTATHRVLVACAGDQVVGFAAIGPAEAAEPGVDEHTGELLMLAVHPDARRSGHGSRLLNAAADTLTANDFTTIIGWLPLHDQATIEFAEQAGLQADGAWRERQVGPDGQTAREIRVQADLQGRR